MDRIIRVIAIVLFAGSFSASAQMGIMGGYSILKGFSNYKAHHGLSLGLEIPRDDAMTIYGRYTHYFKNAYPQDSFPFYLDPRDWSSGLTYSQTTAIPAMNANVIEGGTRYYIGDGYDNGFAGYGGSCLMIMFNRSSYKLGPYDEVNYKPSEYNFTGEGSIFSLGFGLNGGVKYSMQPYGTFYMDAGFSYIIFNQASVESVYFEPYRLLYFSFNFGFRKDILW